MKKALFSSLLVVIVFTACSTKETTIVKKDGKYGFINSTGKEIVKTKYEEVSDFKDINNKNIKQEHLHYLNLHWLHNYSGREYAIVQYKGKYGIINRKNEILLQPIYDYVSKEYGGFFIIKKNKKYGFVNSDFKVVKEPVFKNARDFMSDITFVQSTKNNKWGCITKDMKEKQAASYDDIYNFKNSYARVKKGKKWGFINNKCEEFIKPNYDYVYDFSNGFAKVIKDGKETFINKEGKVIHKAQYQFVKSY